MLPLLQEQHIGRRYCCSKTLLLQQITLSVIWECTTQHTLMCTLLCITGAPTASWRHTAPDILASAAAVCYVNTALQFLPAAVELLQQAAAAAAELLN